MSRKESPHCDFMHVHEEIVQRVNEKMPHEDTLSDLAELFRIFGDSTRIKILYVLFESEMCVCDVAQLLGMTQSAISHQLQILKKSKLIKYPPQRQNGVLLPCRFARARHHRSGHGSYQRIENRGRSIFMKKVFRLENLDCANCASKMESAIKRIPGVTACDINFMTQRLSLEADEARFEDIMKEVGKACKRVEPDCVIRR